MADQKRTRQTTALNAAKLPSKVATRMGANLSLARKAENVARCPIQPVLGQSEPTANERPPHNLGLSVSFCSWASYLNEPHLITHFVEPQLCSGRKHWNDKVDAFEGKHHRASENHPVGTSREITFVGPRSTLQPRFNDTVCRRQ